MIAFCFFPKGGPGLELPARLTQSFTDGPGHCSAGNPNPVGRNCSWEEKFGVRAEPEARGELTQNPLWAQNMGRWSEVSQGKQGWERPGGVPSSTVLLRAVARPRSCKCAKKLLPKGLAMSLRALEQDPVGSLPVGHWRCSPCQHHRSFPRFLPGFLPILRLLSPHSKQDVVFGILVCTWGVPGHCQEDCYSHFQEVNHPKPFPPACPGAGITPQLLGVPRGTEFHTPGRCSAGSGAAAAAALLLVLFLTRKRRGTGEYLAGI